MWFALRTTPNRDFIARAAIERRGIQTFLPIERIQRWRRKGKMRKMQEIERALVRGYLFVNLASETDLIDLLYDMAQNRVVGTRLILGCVEVAGRPGIVSSADIEALRRFDGRLLTPDAPRIFMAGEKVIIQDGPLTGTAGKILTTRNGKLRIDTARGIVEIRAEAVA